MSYESEFGDFLISSIQIYTVSTTMLPADRKLGISTETQTLIYTGMCQNRPYAHKRTDGVIRQKDEVPLDIPNFEARIPIATLPKVPLTAMKIVIEGEVYPLLRPPFVFRAGANTDLDHILLYLGPPNFETP
jgi:hypothetical protein